MSQLTFNPDTGLEAPTTEEIREEFGAKIQECFKTNPDDPLLNIEPSSPMGQVLDLFVAEIEAKNAEIMYLANSVNPDSAQGKFLDALASLYGLDRKISEPTIVTCTLTGLKGTFIPYGVIVQDTSGNQFRHSAATGATIASNGKATSQFSAIEHGALEVPANTVTKIVTVVAGWDSVNNPSAGATGRIEETDAELRNRMFLSYAMNATGSVDAIRSNLADLSGVIDVVVLENPTNASQTQYNVGVNPHSIAVCIVGGEDSDIAKVIYERKDAGCGTTGTTTVTYTAEDAFKSVYKYNIIRPTSTTFAVRLTFADADMPDTEKAVVRTAVVNDFLGKNDNPRVGLASTVYASRFYKSVQSATTYPLVKIEVKLGSGSYRDSVEIPANQEPTMATSNVAFVFSG